jgi:signal peptidase I
MTAMETVQSTTDSAQFGSKVMEQAPDSMKKEEGDLPTNTSGRRLRRLWLLGVLIIVALMVVRLLFIQGLIKPVRVVSGSMAPGLLGEHYEVDCGDCGFRFVCGVDQPPAGEVAVCPNCSYAKNDVTAEHLQRGERVLIDKVPLMWRSPRRWEVVAFRSPENDELAVKRVVGLPGEKVAIKHGDVYIDGQILRKSLDEQRAMAVLVHDDRFRPQLSNALPPRWRSDTEETQWRAEMGGYVFEAAAVRGVDLDQLNYHHWRCYSSPLPRDAPATMTDSDGYNQGLSRELNDVTDMMLVGRMEMSGEGRLTFSANDGRDAFEVEFDTANGLIRLRRGNREMAKTELPNWIVGREVKLEFSLCDQQVWLAIDGQVLLSQSFDPPEHPSQPSYQPLSIAADRLQVRLRDLQVLRDVYYLEPLGTGRDWSLDRPLADDGYFLLGDNPPISTDSRHLASGGLVRKRLVGKVLHFW